MGFPLPPFTTLAAEAEAWTVLAGLAELRAYFLACWLRMPPSVRLSAVRALLKRLGPADREVILREFGGHHGRR